MRAHLKEFKFVGLENSNIALIDYGAAQKMVNPCMQIECFTYTV
jgi:hypothetical protein